MLHESFKFNSFLGALFYYACFKPKTDIKNTSATVVTGFFCLARLVLYLDNWVIINDVKYKWKILRKAVT